MNFEVELSPNFTKELKRLVKKYPSLKSEIKEIVNQLQENPTQGIHLGNDVYKIRFSIASKGRGKSGGGRIISLVKVIDNMVVLLTIYDKGDIDTIKDHHIQILMEPYL
jgi:mRNA-degrading endonuclease RelE of RelBE toxin-antitoxin system